MQMLLLYTIIIFISVSDNVLCISDNETLAFNNTINTIITSKIQVNTSQLNETTMINNLYGRPDVDDSSQYLDIFEPEEAKRLLGVAQTKGQLIERELNKTRRWYWTPGFVPDSYFLTKSIDFMKQSIYGTRYRLKKTKYLRKRYANDIAYNVAVLYGSLMQIRLKLDNIYATLSNFDRNVNFLWFIVLYERCIATTVDANFMVERMFALKQQEMKEVGAEDYFHMNPPNPNKGTMNKKLYNP